MRIEIAPGVRVFVFALGLCSGWPAPAAEPRPIPAGALLQSQPIRIQFAVFYLDAAMRDPVAALRLPAAAAPGGPRFVATLPAQPPAQPVFTARLDSNAQASYRPPDMDMLQRFGRGLSREQALALQKSERALILDFVHPPTSAAASLRAALVLAERLAREGHGLLWDEETREVFTADEWHRRRLETWVGDLPDVTRHTVIHAYKSKDTVRAITLGMAKFGLPDVVVEDFPWSLNAAVGNVINLFAQSMVEGATIARSGEFDLDFRKVRHAAVREPQLASLRSNASAAVQLTLVAGVAEAGDPRNRLVELRFERGPGADRYARQEAMLGSLFGSSDPVSRVRHNEELLAASRAAAARLPGLRQAFAEGLQPGEYILVKAPFKTRTGGNEWMWVEVLAWSGDSISGLLKNDPVDIDGLRAGTTVTVSQREVFDYLRRRPGRPDEGNETSRIIQRMSGARP